MGRFVMSKEQFEELESLAQHSDKIKSFKKTGDNSGVIDTSDVTVDFNYDPGTQALNFNVGKRHSLAAHMASDNVIERHITDLLYNLERPEQPKPQDFNATTAINPNPAGQTKPVNVGGFTVKPTIAAPKKEASPFGKAFTPESKTTDQPVANANPENTNWNEEQQKQQDEQNQQQEQEQKSA